VIATILRTSQARMIKDERLSHGKQIKPRRSERHPPSLTIEACAAKKEVKMHSLVFQRFASIRSAAVHRLNTQA
jgi:hypothetical protein